jgi:CheY-like chemotaxis protein
MLRRRLARALGERGFQVLAAQDGLEAWELLQDGGQPIHAVVTDIRMPRMDGLGLAHRVQSLPNPPGLVSVSWYGEHDLNALQPFLAKPLHPDQLAALLRQSLDADPLRR